MYPYFSGGAIAVEARTFADVGGFKNDFYGTVIHVDFLHIQILYQILRLGRRGRRLFPEPSFAAQSPVASSALASGKVREPQAQTERENG